MTSESFNVIFRLLLLSVLPHISLPALPALAMVLDSHATPLKISISIYSRRTCSGKAEGEQNWEKAHPLETLERKGGAEPGMKGGYNLWLQCSLFSSGLSVPSGLFPRFSQCLLHPHSFPVASLGPFSSYQWLQTRSLCSYWTWAVVVGVGVD